MTTTVKDPILIDVPMPIVTPRLILRPVMPGDGAAIADAVAETWDDLRRWMDWADKPEDHTPSQQEIRSRQFYAKFVLREDIHLIGLERDSFLPVLRTGLHDINWRTRIFTIGYWVRKSAHNKGYATESTNALLRYAFNELQARRVRITHAEGNDASRRVIERLGFEREGYHRDCGIMPDGRVVNGFSYARLNTDNLPPLDVRWGMQP